MAVSSRAAALAASAVASVKATTTEALNRGWDNLAEAQCAPQQEVDYGRFDERRRMAEEQYGEFQGGGEFRGGRFTIPEDPPEREGRYRSERRRNLDSEPAEDESDISAWLRREVLQVDDQTAARRRRAQQQDRLHTSGGTPYEVLHEQWRSHESQEAEEFVVERSPIQERQYEIDQLILEQQRKSREQRRAADGLKQRTRAGQDSEYLLDDGLLDESCLCGVPGLMYRFTPSLDDRDGDSDVARWGTTVMGLDQGNGWIRVGQRYLPMAISGIPVMTCQALVANTDAGDLAEGLNRLRRAAAAAAFFREEEAALRGFALKPPDPGATARRQRVAERLASEKQPLTRYRVVHKPRVAVRAKAEPAAEVVDVFDAGTEVVVTSERDGEWLRVSGTSWRDPAEAPPEAWVLRDGRSVGLGKLLEPLGV